MSSVRQHTVTVVGYKKMDELEDGILSQALDLVEMNNLTQQAFFDVDVRGSDSVSDGFEFDDLAGIADEPLELSDIQLSQAYDATVQKYADSGSTFSRFKPPVTSEDVKAFEADFVSESSRKKWQWALRLYEEWVTHRNNLMRHYQHEEPPIRKTLKDMSEQELDDTLSKFVAEIRKKNGEEYPGKSLFQIITSIQAYLRHECGLNVTLIDKTLQTFRKLNSSLNHCMKAAAAEGIGVETRQAEVITKEEENVLWERGILGSDTPLKLRDTLVWLFELNFALRAGQEHRNLRLRNSQISIKEGKEGRFLEYIEEMSKNNPGGLRHQKIKRKVGVALENKERPERCPVYLYEKYISHCPEGDIEGDPFYLRPLDDPKGSVWYYKIAAGKDTLTNVVSRLMKAGGFTGFYSNHSLRATCATRLYSANVPEQIIQETTGHRSTDGVRAYKRTSSEQIYAANKLLRSDTPAVSSSSTSRGNAMSSSNSGNVMAVSSDIESSPSGDGKKVFSLSCNDMSFQLTFE